MATHPPSSYQSSSSGVGSSTFGGSYASTAGSTQSSASSGLLGKPTAAATPKSRLKAWGARLDNTSLRERLMMLVGLPIGLIVLAQFAVFAPAKKKAQEASQQTVAQNNMLKDLSEVLAAQPPLGTLPAADQLNAERNLLQVDIRSARAMLDKLERQVDWGTVIRSAASKQPGVLITKASMQSPVPVYDFSKIKPPVAPKIVAAAPPAPAKPGAASPAPAPGTANTDAHPLQPFAGTQMVYRHAADLEVQGDLAAVVSFVQTLQNLPGDLHWGKVQLKTTEYPKASATMQLHTLSTRKETPFN